MDILPQNCQVISTFTEENFHDYPTRRSTQFSVRILSVIRYIFIDGQTFGANGLENNETPVHPVLPSVTLAVSEIINRKERCISSFWTVSIDFRQPSSSHVKHKNIVRLLKFSRRCVLDVSHYGTRRRIFVYL